jgi:hypothetical protein
MGGKMMEKLYPVAVQNLWGYIDKTGSIRITPQFLYGGPFSEGLAAVKCTDGSVAIINPSGAILRQFNYAGILSFKNGRARFIVAEGKMGFMNTNGDTIIAPDLDTATVDYDEGLTIATRNQEDIVFDINGNVVKTYPIGSFQSVFSSGLAAKTENEAGDLIGYIDTNFEWVIPPQFEIARVFSENKAFVRSTVGEGFYIDCAGKRVFGGLLSGAPFSEGAAAVSFKSSCETFVDHYGKRLFDKEFLSLCAFCEGRASAEFEPNKIGFINKRGETVIPPIFDVAYSFDDGLANVQLAGELDLSYVNRSGDLIWRSCEGPAN